MTPLVLVADYPSIPDYVYDCIFNNNNFSDQIFILSNKSTEFESQISRLRYSKKCEITVLDIRNYKSSSLEFTGLNYQIRNFRNGFWLKTIERYFVLLEFMKREQLDSVFHIENDVLLFTHLDKIHQYLVEDKECMYACRDNEQRVIGSLMYIPNADILEDFCNSSLKVLEEDFCNDMVLLDYFFSHNPDKTRSFPTSPSANGIVDAACFGQCLFGVDPRNDIRNTVGFVNETSDFKPEIAKFNLVNNQWHYELSKLHSLHVHSKELFRAIPSQLKIEDIKHVSRFAETLPDILEANLSQVQTGQEFHIKTDFVPTFEKQLNKLANPIVLYVGEGDIAFKSHKICESNKIIKVFAQNPGISHSKIVFVPIGIANSIWRHGNKQLLLDSYLKNRKWKKENKLFVSMDDRTFFYRTEILNGLRELGIRNKRFSEQSECWDDMAKSKYVLCMRGAGFDTHRFYEALILGCLPVVINNSKTDMKDFMKYLHKEKYPMIEITEESTEKICEFLKKLNDGLVRF